ncbi:DUF3576 domain-containing protein [Pelagibius sp.]|uniref:DUF3576 domain-containing protein n=1 Tax=Pelagibius sp. TaxID=1931238 RepID=UPI003B508EE4
MSLKATTKPAGNGSTPTGRMLGLRLAAAAMMLAVSACGLQGEAKYYDETEEKLAETRGSILGNDQIGVNNGQPESLSGGDAGIGVNSYLWRASLDTVSFMPLASADPFGGVIITDWFSPPESAGERFKINVYILGRDLRADGVRAAVFRQLQDPRSGAWIDAAVEDRTPVDIENAILTRARQLRIASIQ